MYDKLAEVEIRFDEISQMMVDPEVISNRNLYVEVTKEHAELSPIVGAFRRLKAIETAIGIRNCAWREVSNSKGVNPAMVVNEVNKTARRR